MKNISLLILCLSLLLIQTGCWNTKEIQTMAYVTAIGLDYKDGKFVTYVQVLNFSNVAKTEGTQVGKSIPNWIGKGEGKTVTESFNAIYATSQIRMFLGHVKAIILGEGLLKNGDHITEVYDMINRYSEVRYNVLLYGTKTPMTEIFAQKSLLNFSPLDTMMFSPSQIFSQRSFILPVYGYKFISHMYEPAGPGMLPSIAIDYKSWNEDYKEKSMLRIDGAFFFTHTQLKGWLHENDLRGIRWIQKKMERSPVRVAKDGKPVAALILLHPKPKITPVVQDGKVSFNLSVRMKGFVNELIEDLPEKEMEAMAAEVVKEEIRSTYKKGVAMQADVYSLDEVLYRDNPKEWHALHDKQQFLLTEDSLKKIDVTVNLLHSGKYKGQNQSYVTPK